MIETWPITSREEWLEKRKQDITASTAGALLGLHPYCTPLQLYLDKTGIAPMDNRDNPAMRRGRLLEPVAMRIVQEEHPDWRVEAPGLYFRDPDKHWLEILQFPEGKGDAKWQRKDRLFLGIDHTAIVVGNTEASLKFYRDALGLQIAGTSENYGTEQEHLNNVFGARLRITSLRAGSGGPGIEFLEYLAPRDGRPAPSDERASDLFHWQTTLVVNAADMFAQNLLAGDFRFVSPGVVAIADGRLGFSKGFLARDPDGHVMALVEK